jgi:transcriptional regulator with XRE-family HTH domain
MNEFTGLISGAVQADEHVPERRKNNRPLNADAAAYYQQVALNMRRARRNLNLTQQQVADSMGLPRSTYKSLESGKTAIYCYHMAKWSKITGYDVRVLTKGSAYDLTSDLDGFELVELIQGLPKKQYDAIVELVKLI